MNYYELCRKLLLEKLDESIKRDERTLELARRGLSNEEFIKEVESHPDYYSISITRVSKNQD